MQLLRHKELKAIEGLLEQVSGLEAEKFATKTRTKIRQQLRKIADRKSDYSAERNGKQSFDTWCDGFDFAASVPAGTDVVYFHQMHSDVVFFYKPATIEALEKALPGIRSMLKEAQDFEQVALVHFT